MENRLLTSYKRTQLSPTKSLLSTYLTCHSSATYTTIYTNKGICCLLVYSLCRTPITHWIYTCLQVRLKMATYASSHRRRTIDMRLTLKIHHLVGCEIEKQFSNVFSFDCFGNKNQNEKMIIVIRPLKGASSRVLARIYKLGAQNCQL